MNFNPWRNFLKSLFFKTFVYWKSYVSVRSAERGNVQNVNYTLCENKIKASFRFTRLACRKCSFLFKFHRPLSLIDHPFEVFIDLTNILTHWNLKTFLLKIVLPKGVFFDEIEFHFGPITRHSLRVFTVRRA